MPQTGDCSRCARPAELAPLGIASINGHTIDPCLICTECEEVWRTNQQTFWREGWKRYPPTPDVPSPE